jgi:MFS family permease
LRENPPWLFGILNIPYGTFNAIVTTLIPFLLRKRGFPVNEIADVVAIASIPSVWYVLWSPVVDIGLLRRTWVLIASGASALCAWVAIVWPSASLVQITAILFAGSVVGMLLSSANGAVLQTLNPAVHGRASGWYQAGNLGGGALGAGATIWLAGFLHPMTLGAVATGLIVLPALAALQISEERVARVQAAALFRALVHDVWDVLKSPRTLIGLTFFLSPVGSAAVGNLISSVGPDYHASDSQVAFVSGVAGGLLSAAGCMVGGFICDRVNRTTAYAVAGLFSAIFAMWMAIGPANAFTYTGAYTGYALGAGFAYAAFTALVLEVLGKRRHAAGSAYSLLVASGNVPIAYMTWADGVAYKHLGVKGLMGADALANGAGALILLAFARFAARRWLRENPA